MAESGFRRRIPGTVSRIKVWVICLISLTISSTRLWFSMAWSISVAMVEKEVMMHAVSYNLVRSLMQEAAIRHQVDLTRISFKGTADALRHWSASLEALRGMPRKQQVLLGAMFELIANDLVPHRPGREEPRAKKRRPKNYHLLTKPRHEMRISGHRNRPTRLRQSPRLGSRRIRFSCAVQQLQTQYLFQIADLPAQLTW